MKIPNLWGREGGRRENRNHGAARPSKGIGQKRAGGGHEGDCGGREGNKRENGNPNDGYNAATDTKEEGSVEGGASVIKQYLGNQT